MSDTSPYLPREHKYCHFDYSYVIKGLEIELNLHSVRVLFYTNVPEACVNGVYDLVPASLKKVLPTLLFIASARPVYTGDSVYDETTTTKQCWNFLDSRYGRPDLTRVPTLK